MAFPPDVGDDVVHFRSAVEANSGNARAHAWLARVHARKGDRSAAGRHLKEARKLAPEDPEVYWLAASGIEERTRRSGVQPDDPAGNPWNRAASLYRQALERAPDHYPSMVGLGSSCLFGDDLDPAEGRDLLQRAYEANPSNLEVLVDWICVEAKAGDLDRAWSLVDAHLRPRGQADAVRRAEYALAEKEARTAGDLMAAGDREAALLRLQSMMHRTRNPNVREMAMSWGLLITGQLGGDHHDEVSRYNEVVSLANAGRTEEALERIRDLVPRIESEHLRETAGNLEERLTAQLRRQAHIDRYNEAVSLIRKGELESARTVLSLLVAENPDEPVAGRARELLERLSRN
jgi:tetratricopeptide (TPR) repeat protein